MDSVLQIEHLVDLICRFTRPQDAARLARTSRQFFHFATPVVWKHVDNVSHLFKLVTGVEISDYTNRRGHLVLFVGLPESFSRADFARFDDVYAPFVRSLEILGGRANAYYGVPNMPILLSYAQQHELLPNLEILRLTAEQGRKTQSLLWAHVFASQSVREIWFLPNPHYKSPLITISDISALIKMIVQRCQRIQTLGIFAEYDSLVQHQVQQPHSLFASQDHELLANTLAHATSLTRLAGNTMLLERGVFATLGRLPLLSDLEMYCTPRGWTRNVQHSDHALLSDGAFPLLRRLSLCDASEQHLDFIWDSPTLVARLDALEISLSIPINRPTVDMLMSHIPLLCQNGPQLTRLALDFGPGGHKGSQYAICVITQDIFECLVHLPLTELVISRAGLDHKVSDNRLAGAWPDMEVFIWTARWVPLPGLWLFAKYMPKLRHLALEIELVPLSEETALVGAALFCNSMLRALEGGFYQLHRYTADEAYELHRYLSALYPKAHLENWLDKHTEALSRWKPHEHLLRFLNIFSATTCDEPIDAEAKRSLFKRQWDMAMTEARLLN